jgi:hypothetical protein
MVSIATTRMQEERIGTGNLALAHASSLRAGSRDEHRPAMLAMPTSSES